MGFHVHKNDQPVSIRSIIHVLDVGIHAGN